MMTVRPATTAEQPTEPDAQASGLIWVKCPHPVVALGLEAALRTVGHVYCGEEAPVKSVPSSIIYCPNGEDVGSEVRRLRVLAQDVPVLVLGLGVDPRLALTALLAGARGFIHVGMQPAQIACALSTASKGATVVPRELLEAFLVERESREDRLADNQREILELIAEAATSAGEIAFPEELLEAFLVEVVMA
jgi:DNA-binding NarL/FixJ family response regulator